MLTRDRITLGILAGGQARRLGGMDKALLPFHGQSLIERTRDSLGSGFAQVLISHNRERDDRIEAIGQIVADLRPGFPGPLAGLEALFQAATCEWLLTSPVDLRDIPVGLPELLCRELDEANDKFGIAIADADGLQPLLAIWPVAAARVATAAALDAGDLAVHRLVTSLQFRLHDISPLRLGNLNSPTDFE